MYLHESVYISPQQTYPEIDLSVINPSQGNKLTVKEPSYPGVPTSLLRRMGKAVRYGVGSALPIFELNKSIHGIVLGTGHGGMEDCIKFLNQIIEYEEGTLTPTNFVQSTTNAIASQLGMMSTNTGHNSTHVHGGLCFEGALIETKMLLQEFPDHTYLLGGVEEISTYQYNIEKLGGWHKKEECSNDKLYSSGTSGSLAGEGAAMFLANNIAENAKSEVLDIVCFETENPDVLIKRLKSLLEENAIGSDLGLLSGENGDVRFQHFYDAVESYLPGAPVLRFKHLTGDYASVTSAAIWYSSLLFENGSLPEHMIKSGNPSDSQYALIYNSNKGIQHSLILLRKP